jgi:hypothetical protein
LCTKKNKRLFIYCWKIRIPRTIFI